jgi:calcineurin-like phosphoesterase family protein
MIEQLDLHHFVSDLHIGHLNVIRHDNRPYESIEQHDRDLTRNCFKYGYPSRTLWILGDVAARREGLQTFMAAIRPYWGAINLIRGNHDDKVAWRHRDLFDEAHEARYLRINKDVRVYLSHYAHRVWRNSHRGAFHLYGHSHGSLPGVGRSMDVSANCINYTPISMRDVMDKLKNASIANHH